MKIKSIIEVVAKLTFTKCGAVTCIHNVDGKCAQSTCELHEKALKQEEA